MKFSLLLGFFLLLIAVSSSAQNVFDPNDPIIRHDPSKPYGSAQYPDSAKIGLQKWVSRPTSGVSYGNGAYDASSFKQYYLNTGNGKVAFRLKFPHSYTNPDSASKKYPIDLFLHGGGEVGCPTNGGIYNNERPIWLGGQLFKDAVDNNKFDGFLLYPQYVVYEGCFSGWLQAPSNVLAAIIAVIDSMEKYVRADIDRVVVTGLSGGGYGAWRIAELFPKRIAKIMPSAASGNPSNRNAFVHIPIWFATGGKDLDPSPADAQNKFLAMKNLGANIKYTQYPEKGHSMWYNHWNEPDFIPQMNDIHKANPLIFFGRDGFCDPDAIDAKLGLTAGFYAYEWQKDGVLVATSVNNVKTTLDNSVVTTNNANEIVVRQFGSYRARFRRTASSDWSEWSPKPAVIKPKTATQTLPIKVKGARSKVLPALDGSTTVPLTLADGFIKYEWYDAETNIKLDSVQVHEAGTGVYKGRYSEEYGCGADFSNEFKVVDANGTPKPAPAINLAAVPLSQSVTRLTWTDGGSGETGYEVYRSTTSGGPYQFVALTAANATQFRDSSLANNVVYHYVLRAVSETGASAASNEAIARTLTDNKAPTAPSNLNYTQGGGPTVVNLTWNKSTDNSGIISRYDIYVNEQKVYSSTVNSFQVTGLDSLMPYRFTVKAVDSSGNISPASNQVTYLPPGTVAGAIPGTPADVSATPLSYNSIKISWNDTTSSENGFEIVRAEAVNGTYIPVGTVNTNGVAFTDSALSSARQYFYKVRAIGNSGQSAFSAPVSATTQASPATPVAPSQLAGLPGDNNTVSLTWTDNSANENNFLVYRSGDNVNFTLVATLPANTNAWTDTSVSASTTYYYQVAGRNASGVGQISNTIQVKAGNKAPVINLLPELFVKATATAIRDFTVADDAGDSVTVLIENKPPFVTIDNPSAGTYRITASPRIADVGSYIVTITATDNSGKSSQKTVTISVGDKNTRSVYVNFGSGGKSAPAPWNNWLGKRSAGDILNNLKDENNTATSISISSLANWSNTTNMGHITGANSGVLPDAVLASGILDADTIKQFKISGLDNSKRYNIVLAGSQNEGIIATASYSAGTQTSELNARYNTNRTANLNNLAPQGGEITVTITRINGSPVTYLNGIVVEEVGPSVQLLNPNNLYAEATDRNTVQLTWSDRTAEETGFEVIRATDSLFTKNLQTIAVPANSSSYTVTGLVANTRYYFRVRAVNGSVNSEFSNVVKLVTAETIVYVNFNFSVAGGPFPWNNLESSPLFNFNTANLLDQSGKSTNISLTLVKEFNGEFTAGVETEGSAGVAPANVLKANYWLDKQQVSQFKVNGLNHSKRYRFGFLGSSSAPVWFKGNYTATYSVHDRTVYLNSWENSSKIVYVDEVAPDPDGTVMLNFSTTPEAGYGFNSGVIIEEYNDDAPVAVPVDTIPGNPVDTLPTNPVDTIPTNPVDTIPTNPVDTIPTNPVDTLPTNPVDTLPTNPVDTLPTNPVDTLPTNPVDTLPTNPVDTLPTNPVDTVGTNPVDTIPTNPVDTLPTNPVDTVPTPPNPIDTIPVIPPDTTEPHQPTDSLETPFTQIWVYPNPVASSFNVKFFNSDVGNKIDIEIYDPEGRILFRRNYGNRPQGTNIINISSYEANMRTGLHVIALKINGEIKSSLKVIRNNR